MDINRHSHFFLGRRRWYVYAADATEPLSFEYGTTFAEAAKAAVGPAHVAELTQDEDGLIRWNGSPLLPYRHALTKETSTK